MNLPLIVFFFFALLAVAGAVMLILAREPIHSALSLILVMAALATLYLLLGAEFIAAVQMIVYAGAVMVLFVFVIMLLNMGVEERTNFSKFAYVGVVGGFVLLLEIGHWLFHSPAGKAIVNGPEPVKEFSTVELSKLLFRSYLLPFEATSILILIAILGALALARKEE